MRRKHQVEWKAYPLVLLLVALGVYLTLNRECAGHLSPEPPNGVPCGLECLVRIFHKNHILITPDTLQAIYSNSTFTSFMEIKKVAEDFGFIARGYQLSYTELKRKKGEIICHFKENHFVVVEDISSGNITVFSPPKKVIVMPISNFLKRWDGYVLEIQKGENLRPINDVFPEPRFYTEVQEYNFGIVKEDKIIEYSYEFYNLGEKTLKINEIHASCNCTTATVNKREISPLSSGVLKVVFDSTGRIGQQILHVVLLTNDPQNPEMEFILTGEIRRELEYFPKNVNVGILQPFVSKTRRITFIGAGEKPLEVERVISSNKNKIRNIKILPYDNDPYRVAVQFEVNWDEKPGIFKESITAHFKHGIFKPVTISIEGENASALQVEPAGIFLNAEPGNRKITGYISISNITKNHHFAIEGVTSDIKTLDLRLEREKDGYDYRVIYNGTIPEGTGAGLIGKIYIRTNLPYQREIEIPLFFIGEKKSLTKSRKE